MADALVAQLMKSGLLGTMLYVCACKLDLTQWRRLDLAVLTGTHNNAAVTATWQTKSSHGMV